MLGAYIRGVMWEICRDKSKKLGKQGKENVTGQESNHTITHTQVNGNQTTDFITEIPRTAATIAVPSPTHLPSTEHETANLVAASIGCIFIH